MINLFIAGAVAAFVSAVGLPVLIQWLRRHGVGQQIRDDGPERHSTKAGTPTMGGVAIVVSMVVGYAVAHPGLRLGYSRAAIMVVLVTAGAAAVGFIDDWIKVSRHRSLGLTMRTKLVGEVVVAIGFAAGALAWSGVGTNLSFTRYDSLGIALGRVGWAIFAILVVVGTSNAVNLTDGLDGLAAGSSTFAFGVLVIMGYWQSRHSHLYGLPPAQALDLAVVAVAMAGACTGFLWWNAAPARIFMGDTGSLAIGAALAALCLQMQLDLLLPIIGGLFVLVTMSVVVQVASFRLFHRRVFRMAPLHHHFELLGWPETTVIIRFWILAGICTAIALGIFYADYIAARGPGL